MMPAMAHKDVRLPAGSMKAVIFDLDGTLVDSAGEIAAALNATLAELDRPPFARREVEALIGRGVRVLVERALRIARVTGASLDQAVARFEAHYAANVGRHASLFPGVRDGLERLRADGISMAVVTNKPRYFTEQLLRSLEIDDFFAATVAGDDGIARKPAGDMLVAAARQLGVDLDSVLMIGDSENDVDAAREAGCVVWCVPYGYNEGRTPESLSCDRLVRSVQEAAELLLPST
jgi:phosphoglycolate phosphatase